MKKLSVCIIAKNEEKMLGDCIDSVAAIADEIIVVDTGSTDGTKEIAKAKNCILIESEWKDDFSYSRNISLDAASSEFILVLDADERLLNPNELLNSINSADENSGAWLVDLVSSESGEINSSQAYYSKILRLFRRHLGIRFEGAIHEQVLFSILNLNYKILNSNVKILHLGYDLPQEQLIKKQLRNLALLDKSIAQEPNNAYNLTHRANTLNALGRFDEAHSDYARSLELLPSDNKMRIRALNAGASNAYKLGMYDIAEAWAYESFNLLNKQSLANFILAELYFEQKKFDFSLKHYLMMREAQTGEKDFWVAVAGDYYIPLDHVGYKIGRCYFFLNDYQAAANEYSLSFEMNNLNVLGLIGLANIAFNLKKYDESKKMLETALAIDPDKKEIYDFLKAIEIASGGLKVDNVNIESSKKTTTLSVCMIVKNEEKMLPDCLQSVAGVADEIIISDTGSNDKTVEIAKSFGAKVFHFNWIDDFSAARNNSLKHCTSDWILYIDADERLSEESQKYIKTYISEALSEIGAMICTVESAHFQMDGSNEVHRGGYPRLFRNLGFPKVKFIGKVHEQISPSIVEAGLNFAVSDIKIIHLGYDQSRDVMEEKVRRNYKMLLAHVQEEPLNGYAWFQLGQTLAQMGIAKEAEDAIRFAINCRNLSNTILASASAALAQITGKSGNYEESLEWAEKSLNLSPNQLFALTLKGFALLNLRRPKEAMDTLNEALNIVRNGSKIINSQSAAYDIDISENVLLKGIGKARLML